MICFLFPSPWNELSQEPHTYTLHSKSALRKAELPRALHWFADGRNGGGGGSAGSAPPAAVGAGKDGTESLIQWDGCSKVCWSADSVWPPLWAWQSNCCSSGHRERVHVVRKGASKHTRFERRASKGGGSAAGEIHSGLAKGEAKKWLRLEVEKKTRELQFTL